MTVTVTAVRQYNHFDALDLSCGCTKYLDPEADNISLTGAETKCDKHDARPCRYHASVAECERAHAYWKARKERGCS